MNMQTHETCKDKRRITLEVSLLDILLFVANSHPSTWIQGAAALMVDDTAYMVGDTA